MSLGADSMPVTTTDRLCVAELLARANHAFDDVDGGAFARCFTPTGILISSRGSYEGPEQLAGYVESSRTRPPHLHFTTNTVIAPASDQDRLAVRSNYLYVEQTGMHGATETRIGTYLDTLVRAQGEWLISHRHARSVHGS